MSSKRYERSICTRRAKILCALVIAKYVTARKHKDKLVRTISDICIKLYLLLALRTSTLQLLIINIRI